MATRKLAASGAADGLGCTDGEAALWLDILPSSRFESPAQQQ